MKSIRKLFSALAAAAMTLTALPVLPMPAAAQDYGLASRSPAEIRAFYRAHPWTVSDTTVFSEQPSTASPQVLGAVGDASLERAVNCVNFFRYAAGLPADVTVDDDLAEKAQAASLVSAMNGQLSHTPSQPGGLSDDLYALGKTGAGSCNLGDGYSTLPESIVDGYMYDSDSYNIPMVGHRRWILNPSMQKTGFGQVGRFSAMYAIDTSRRDRFTGDYVAWPPENMPYQFYSASRYAFSVSLGSSYDAPSGDTVSVTIHSQKKNTDYLMDNSTTNYFAVNNQGYGMNRCIIFWPGVRFDMDDQLTVTVNGLTKSGSPASLSYPVSFFDLYAEDEETTTTTTTTTTTSGYLPELRTGEIMFNFSEPGKEFDITVTPRGRTLEKVSVRFYGVNGEITEQTVLDDVLTGTDPFKVTVKADYVSDKVNVSATYRGDSPRMRCVCNDAGQYEAGTAPPESERIYTMGQTFNYNDAGSNFRLRVVPSGGALERILVRYFDDIGGTQEVAVLNSTLANTFDQTLSAPFSTKKITVTVSFRGSVPSVSCTQIASGLVTSVTSPSTTTETTTTTTRDYGAMTITMKFSFPQKGNDFNIKLSKKGGMLVGMMLYYDGRSFNLQKTPEECSRYGETTEFEFSSYNAIDEFTIELTYTGSLPELDAYMIGANGSKIHSETNFRGDVDCSGRINIADAVMLARYNAEDRGVKITAIGKLNADTDQNGLIETEDLARLLQYLAGSISSF